MITSVLKLMTNTDTPVHHNADDTDPMAVVQGGFLGFVFAQR